MGAERTVNGNHVNEKIPKHLLRDSAERLSVEGQLFARLAAQVVIDMEAMSANRLNSAIRNRAGMTGP